MSSLRRFAKTAEKDFRLLKTYPRHPSLRLKKAGRFSSVRVGGGYRALGVASDDVVVWFWIGRATATG